MHENRPVCTSTRLAVSFLMIGRTKADAVGLRKGDRVTGKLIGLRNNV